MNTHKPIAITAALSLGLLAVLAVLVGAAGAQGGYNPGYDVAPPWGQIDVADIQAVAARWGTTGVYTSTHTHWGETWTGTGPGLTLSGTATLPTLRTYNNSGGVAVSGRSDSGNAVYGQSDSTNTSKAAIYGYSSEHATGVYGESTHGYGVYGNGGDEAGDYGGYFVGHGGVRGVGENEPGGYFESANDDAVYADGDVTINGDLAVLGTANIPNYAHVIVVAKSGGDFTSVQAALDSITDATESDPYLVWVAPGTYLEQVILKPYVHLQGAGQDITIIFSTVSSSAWPPTGTVVITDSTRLSNLTVVNAGSDEHAAISARDVSAPAVIRQVTAIASGMGSSHGIVLASADQIVVEHSTVRASVSDLGESKGIENWDSDATIEDCTINVSGGTSSYGVQNRWSSPKIRRSTISASGASNDYGIWNYATGLDSFTVWIDSCQIIGSSSTIYNDDQFTVLVGASLLDGGNIVGSGTVTCAGVYDENYTFYANTCP